MKCVWEECWPEEGDSKKIPQQKVLWLGCINIMYGWKCHIVGEAGREQEHQSHGMPAAPQWGISWAVEWHPCSSLPCQQFVALVIWGREGDALPGLDLSGPQCPEHCLGAVIKCHIRNKKKGGQERVQILKCRYISCEVSIWSRNKNFSKVDLEMGVCQQASERLIGPKYC